MNYINNIDHDDFILFKSLKESALFNSNRMIVESQKVLLKLFKSNISIHKVLVSENFILKNPNFFENSKLDQNNIYVIPDDISENIKGHNWHNGVMALTDRPKNLEITELAPPYLILNGLTSPENVGTIIRTACAFGIKSVLIDSKTVSPFNRRCIRVSIGNIFEMKVRKSENLIEDLEKLKDQKIKILVAANEEKSVDIDEFIFPRDCAVIIGSEGHGVDLNVREKADGTIKIPISNSVAHLNASCATSILLYKLYLDIKKTTQTVS